MAMTIKQDTRVAGNRRGQSVMTAGGVLGALAASSCCILPLVLFSLGVSRAWIANLTRLAPYQPYFLGVAAVCLGLGYWLWHRSRRAVCAEGEMCARPLPSRIVTIGFILAGVLIAAVLALDFLAPLFVKPPRRRWT